MVKNYAKTYVKDFWFCSNLLSFLLFRIFVEVCWTGFVTTSYKVWRLILEIHSFWKKWLWRILLAMSYCTQAGTAQTFRRPCEPIILSIGHFEYRAEVQLSSWWKIACLSKKIPVKEERSWLLYFFCLFYNNINYRWTERLLNILCTLNLRPVSTGMLIIFVMRFRVTSYERKYSTVD